MPYKYIIKPKAIYKVRSFYRNVSLKYRNTYSYEDVVRYINNTVNSIYQIEETLPRRKAMISRWQHYHMAHAGKWYFAYIIDDNTITIFDACHEQNMHDDQ